MDFAHLQIVIITVLIIYIQYIIKFKILVSNIFGLYELICYLDFYHYCMKFFINRKPLGAFCSYFQWKFITMLSIDSQRLIEFVIAFQLWILLNLIFLLLCFPLE